MSAGTPQTRSGIDILERAVTPPEKAAYVRGMFDAIAPRYDLLNNILSLGVHHRWRAFATRCAALQAGDAVLDVCAGTGAWASRLRRAVGLQGVVVGVDFSLPMLQRGMIEFRRRQTAPIQGDATELPHGANCFDAVTVAFGIRNVARIDKAFVEMARVVKPGGRVVCLELAEPHHGTFRVLYGFYSRFVVPNVGGVVSGRREAYAYLPASVARFRSRPELAAIMQNAGLTDVRWVDLMFGLVCVHVGVKTQSCL